MFTVQSGVITIEIDLKIYSRDCLLRTAYWFTDRCFVFITRPAEGRFLVQLKAKAPTLDQPSPPILEEMAGEFCNSLLDFQLRQEIEAQTGKVRELIVAKALAESGLLADQPPGDIDDPVDAARRLVQLRADDRP